MKTAILSTIPVLPSADIARDTAWYKEKMGMDTYFTDNMYAVIYRENICFHLQWHAGTPDDPLLGGSVVRILVQHIEPLFREFVKRGAVAEERLRLKTPWNTNEFGFFDLNSNAIFVMEDIVKDRPDDQQPTN